MVPTEDELLRVLYRRSPVGVAFTSLDGALIAVNPGACRLLGRSEKDVVGSSGAALVHPDDRGHASVLARRLVEGDLQEIRNELRFVHPDGRAMWVEALTQAVRDQHGRALYLQTVMVDISARKQAEESRAWLEEVVRSSHDAIIGTTIDGVIMTWNAGAQRIFGYSAEEIIGLKARVLQPPGSSYDIKRLLARTARGDRIEHRVRRRRKDGNLVTLMASTAAIRDTSGAIIGTASVARDVGEEERVEAIFRTLVEAAPDAMVCIDERGFIELVNAQAERLFGYVRDELIGQPVEMLVPNPGGDPVTTVGTEFFAPAPRPIDAGEERTARRKDGREFPAEISWSSIHTQDGVVMSATIRDGTARRQAAIVASSSDAIIGRGLDGGITSWNAAAERMFGYTAAEAIGGPMLVALPSGRLDELLELTEPVLRGERVGETYETQRVRKDGVIIDVSITMSPIRDAGGAIVGSSSVVRDITASKRSREALQASEARKSAILESALDCIITMDHHGHVVEFNPAAERTFGYTRNQVVGRAMAELIIPPAFRARHAAGMAQYWATGEGPILGQRVELTALRADGSEFPVELAVTKVDLPGEPLFTGYLRDVTEQKRIQGELATSQQLLEAMLDNSPALIALKDRHGRYLFINRSLAKIFDVERESAKGLSTADLAPGEGATIAEAHDLELLRTGAPLQYEFVAPDPDGDRTYLVVKFAVFDAAGIAYATASIATDMTELKAIEQERTLLGDRRRQSERLESLGQLAGGVAHDFNNLLSVILNYAAFVAEAVSGDAAVHADVEQIRTAAERAARLTRQLLIVGRRETIHAEIVDLNAVVVDIHDLLARSIGEHIQLTLRPTAGLPTVRADRGQIEQVLLNLAVNARDAMPAGGALTIATTVTDLDDDYVRLHPTARPGPHVELNVSDTGVGMSAEVAARIFEPFFTTKPKGHGTGLGLATVYGIVAEAGGSLSVYSEPGIGTTFRVVLPAVGEPVVPTPALVQTDLEGHGETILVVDDEPALVELAARILRRHGYNVIEAAGGAEALAVAGARDLDLLLTDSIMPRMSGRELAEQIEGLRPGLPVLFMSGYSEGVVGPQRIIAEGGDFVEKPFNAPTLLKMVQVVLSGTAPRPPPRIA